MLPAFNTIYQHYSDEVARNASSIVIEGDGSPSLSGGEQYGPDALVDDNPAKLAKIEATDGAWVLTYAAKQVIQIVALIHHTFDESGTGGSPAPSVRFEGNNTSDFSSPTFSADVTIPAWLGSGSRAWPVNPYLILTDLPGYDAAGFFNWRLVIENNSQNIQLGQLWCGQTIRRFDPDLRWGLTVTKNKPQIGNRTSFEVDTIYSRGTTRWRQQAELMADDVMAAALEQHWYDVEGGARPWLIVPSGPVADDRAYLVRYSTTEQEMQWNWEDWHDMRLGFLEVSRGLRPGV